ncbi:hypothetical protein ACWGCW_19285 [Streptomyces sp. NPDC054933]
MIKTVTWADDLSAPAPATRTLQLLGSDHGGRGFDCGDTLGLLLAVMVTAASVTDRDTGQTRTTVFPS